MFANPDLLLSTNLTPLGGRLQSFLPQWQSLTSDPWVLNVIQGYRLSLLMEPFQSHIPSTHVSDCQASLIDEEVKEMIQKGAVHAVPNSHPRDGFVNSLFLVPKKGGGQRPVINFKGLNQFLKYQHFKVEGIHMLRDLVKENDHLVEIDLKDAYFTIPIWKNHQKYLRFLWKDTLLEFTCLPFGLASAPLVFTKILRPVVALLRKQGVRLIIYLDDIPIMAESVEIAKAHANLAVNLLTSLGFVINHKKSVLNPSQQLEFLGFTVNSVTMTLSLTHDKLRQIRRESKSLLSNNPVSVRELSRFLGKLNASIQAVFPAPLN